MVTTVTVTPTTKQDPPRGHEKLRDFLVANDIGPREAAKALKVTHSAVIGWREGKSIPTEPARVAIEVWTKGSVNRNDWATTQELEMLARFSDVEPFEKHATGTDGPR